MPLIIEKKVGGSVLISDLLIGTGTALLTLKGFSGDIETSYLHKLAVSLCLPLAIAGTYLYQKNNPLTEFLGALLVKFSVSLFGYLFTFIFMQR